MSQIDRNKLVVTQANQLALASYSLTLEEKRVVLLLVSLLRKDDKDFQAYRISMADLQNHVGIRRTDLYTEIKKIAVSLAQRVVKIEKPCGGWIVTNWISSAEYKPKGESGLKSSCMDLCFDPKMKPFLLELKDQFFSYMLSNVAHLRSIYSIRVYEILASYRRLGCVEFEIKELKDSLQIGSKYSRHKDFRKRVIDSAQKELKEKTDICFEYTEERKGRRVHKIHFTIHTQPIPNQPQNQPESPIYQLPKPPENQPTLIPPTEEEKQTDKLLEKAIQLAIENGIQKNSAIKLIGNMPPKHAIENIESAIAFYMRSTKEDKDISSLIVHFLKNDIAAETREKRLKEENVKKQKQEEEKEKKKQEKEDEKRIDFDRSRRDAAIVIYSKMEPEDKKRIFDSIKGKVGKFERDKMEREGEESIGFRIKLSKELNDRLPPELQESQENH